MWFGAVNEAIYVHVCVRALPLDIRNQDKYPSDPTMATGTTVGLPSRIKVGFSCLWERLDNLSFIVALLMSHPRLGV